MSNLAKAVAILTFVCALAACGAWYLAHGRAAAQDEAEEHGHAEETEHDGHDAHAEHEDLVVLTPEQRKELGIEVVEAGSGTVDTRLSLAGEIRLNEDRVAHIVPKLAGVVREVRKSLGDAVREGEVMAVLDSRELASTKAAYLAALERMSLARARFDREKRLWEKKISAEQDYLDARQQLAEAEIEVRSAEQELHALGFERGVLDKLQSRPEASLTRFEMIAPFAGTVIEKHLTLGEAVEPNAGAFVVADLGSVWADFSVHQKDLSTIREGQTITVGNPEGEAVAEGVIAYIGPVMGSETRTATARVILSNEDRRWRPGQFVTGSVAVEERPVGVLVPKAAVHAVEGRPSVFIETEEGFRPVAVTTGASNATHVEIVEGLEPGERYAFRGGFALKAALEKGELGHVH